MTKTTIRKWQYEINGIDEIGGYVLVHDSISAKSTEIEFENIKEGTKLLDDTIAEHNEINLIYRRSNGYPQYLLNAIIDAIKKRYKEIEEGKRSPA